MKKEIPFKKLKVGDIVHISSNYNKNFYNLVLITGVVKVKDKTEITAIWYDNSYFHGKSYTITPYTCVTKIVKRGVDIIEKNGINSKNKNKKYI